MAPKPYKFVGFGDIHGPCEKVQPSLAGPPIRIRPKSCPEDRFPARRNYCVTWGTWPLTTKQICTYVRPPLGGQPPPRPPLLFLRNSRPQTPHARGLPLLGTGNPAPGAGFPTKVQPRAGPRPWGRQIPPQKSRPRAGPRGRQIPPPKPKQNRPRKPGPGTGS